MSPAAVIVDGASFSPEHLNQGELGDCWFVASIAVLASRANAFLSNVILTSDIDPTGAGVYAVRFWTSGHWEDVYVDDMFPVLNEAFWDPDEKKIFGGGGMDIADKRYGTPVFLKSDSHNEFWGSLLEKAYAKYLGSYQRMVSGQMHDFLPAVIPYSIGKLIDLERARDGSVAAEIWASLMGFVQQNALLGAGSRSPPKGGISNPVNAQGIVLGHAYSILRAVDVGGIKLLQLRNPWGNTEWKGAFGDLDHSNWTPGLLSQLGYEENKSLSDNGEFWMQYSDFLGQFSDLYACLVLTPVEAGGSWYRYYAESAWEGRSAGGCTNNPATACFNPQFSIAPTQRCKIHVMLTLVEPRRCDVPKSRVTSGVEIYRKGGKRVSTKHAEDVVASSGFSNSCRHSIEAELDPLGPGDFYTLFCSTFDPGVELSFVVEVYTDSPLSGSDSELSKIPDDVPAA